MSNKHLNSVSHPHKYRKGINSNRLGGNSGDNSKCNEDPTDFSHFAAAATSVKSNANSGSSNSEEDEDDDSEDEEEFHHQHHAAMNLLGIRRWDVQDHPSGEIGNCISAGAVPNSNQPMVGKKACTIVLYIFRQ